MASARTWTAEQITVAAHQFTDGTMKQAEQEAITNGPMKQNPKLREAVQGLWRQQLIGDYARGNMTPAASTLFKRKFLAPGNPMNLFPDLCIVQIGLISARGLEDLMSPYIFGALSQDEEAAYLSALEKFPELKAKVERTKLEFDLEDEVSNYTAGNMTRDEQTAFETRMASDAHLRKLVEEEENKMESYQDTFDYLHDTMTPARKTDFEARMAGDDDLRKLVEEERAIQRISAYVDDTMAPEEKTAFEEEMSSDERLRASVDRARSQTADFLKMLRKHSTKKTTGQRNKFHLR